MSQIVDCTSHDFAGLTNPYTGEAMKVKMLLQADGSVKFFCPSTYSTAVRFGTRKAAYEAWCRAEGVASVRSGQPIVCAYTGQHLTLMQDETGCYFDGGFDPRRFYTRQEFLHYAWMRNGESKYPLEPEPPKVEPVLESDRLKVKHHETEITDDAMTFAGAAMDAAHFAPDKKPTVSMHVSKKAKK